MKKMVLGVALVASAAAFADAVTSSVVGYQTLTINPGFNMIALNFQPLNGTEEIAISNLVTDTSALVAGNAAASADQIQVWDGSKFDVYFYRANKTTTPKWTKGPGWVKSSDSANLTGDTIARGQGVWFARPATAEAGTITVSGAVNAAPKTHDISAGFNMISSAFPTDLVLNGGTINWAECGAVAGNAAASADQIQVWDGEKFDVYFYRANKTTTPKWTKGPGWVKSSDSANLTTDTIPAGKGFWYARPSSSAAGTLVETSPLATPAAE